MGSKVLTSRSAGESEVVGFKVGGQLRGKGGGARRLRLKSKEQDAAVETTIFFPDREVVTKIYSTEVKFFRCFHSGALLFCVVNTLLKLLNEFLRNKYLTFIIYLSIYILNPSPLP